MNSPCVRSESVLAWIKPWRNSLSRSAPTIRITSPIRFRAMISRPRRAPGSQRRRLSPRASVFPACSPAGGRSGFAGAVADAIQGFDRVDLRIDLPELLTHALDVAVDGPVVDVDLILVGRVHQVVAAFHEARALGQGLQQQEFGDRQLHR